MGWYSLGLDGHILLSLNVHDSSLLPFCQPEAWVTAKGPRYLQEAEDEREVKMSESDFIAVPHEKPYKYQEGEYTVTRGSAWSGPGCHLGCGVLLYTDKEGKLVKVEGDPENPFTEGRLCARCLAVPEMVYNEDRLLYPMKRAREHRGLDKWERISWDEAYDLVVDNLSAIREQYGAESVAFIHGTARDIAPWQSRLAWSYGSPNYTGFLSGNSCYLPRVAGAVATTGSFWVADFAQQYADRYDHEGWKVPEVAFIWGNNPLKSNSDGLFGHWVIDCMKLGMEVVVIDPRMTFLGSKAKLYVPIRPGTDAALALAMLNVIISEDLYDHEFVSCWCYGFEELAESVADCTPEWAAEICWTPVEKIYEAAHILAEAKPATLQWGLAVDLTKESLPAGQAIMALFQITGNINIPGGLVPPPEILAYSGGWGRDQLPPEQEEKRLGLDRFKLLQLGFKQSSPDVLIDTVETGVPYEIHAAQFQTSNGMCCMGADPKRVEAAFKKLDFIWAVDLVMTPTIMALADVVMPACTFPERNGIRVGDGPQRGEVINKVISVGECKSDAEINLTVGKRLAPDSWPWETVEEMLTENLKPTGYTFEELREIAPVYLPFEYDMHKTGKMRRDGNVGFQTMTGRIELWSTFYNSAGLDPLPYFEEPKPGPGSTPELVEEYPLVLTTGARDWGYFHSEHRQVKRLRQLHQDPQIEVHPIMLEQLGLHDGDWVWMENPYGRAKARVKSTPILFDPRVVSSDHGWWLPEADPENLYDMHDYAVNNLMIWEPGKSGFGTNYKSSVCKLYKVEDGE